jgi:hypothetical protein
MVSQVFKIFVNFIKTILYSIPETCLPPAQVLPPSPEYKVHHENINKFGSKFSENIYHLHYKDEEVNAILAKKSPFILTTIQNK